MKFTKNFSINWMGSGNPKYIVWLDIKIGRWWYVFEWLKGQKPFLYRSLDATPPTASYRNEGKMLFGKYVG